MELIPNLFVGQKQCDLTIHKVHSCVVSQMEHCEKETPANIKNSTFQFIKTEVCSRAYSVSSKTILTILIHILL